MIGKEPFSMAETADYLLAEVYSTLQPDLRSCPAGKG